MSLANFISLARLLSVPVVVWLILADELVLAFWLFAAAGASDAVDGFVARRFHGRTVVGSYLDPLADKALLMGVYITLGHQGHLAVWLVILVVSRDVLIIGGAVLALMLTKSFKVAPLMVSKFNTVAQVLLAALVLGRLALGFDDRGLSDLLIYGVAATTLLSGGAYLVQWTQRAAGMEDAR